MEGRRPGALVRKRAFGGRRLGSYGRRDAWSGENYAGLRVGPGTSVLGRATPFNSSLACVSGVFRGQQD